jgi:diketogulonate reductase-like aldo/keto reductase
MTPTFIYGTAWKEERTAELARDALDVGFRAIDTANQRKHYVETGVGEALAAAGLARDQVWLQTKFTFQGGQDHRLPYDPAAPVAEQVGQSLRSSLEHLGVDTLDSYVLHGPSQRPGLGAADHEAWRAMERAHAAGTVRALGVSNVSADQLRELLDACTIPPAWAQIRTFAVSGWCADVREVCAEHGIAYQGFSLLTANRAVWHGPVVASLAERHGITPAQVIYAFARQVGMVPLMGSTDRAHMAEALASLDVELSEADVERVRVAGLP